MEKFARLIVGYHGCQKEFSDRLLTGDISISDWKSSENKYDWLGRGIYFWEHSPDRALRWAKECFGDQDFAVVGCIIQLGACFDLLDEKFALLLGESFPNFRERYEAVGQILPENRGVEKKLRFRDCAVINNFLSDLELESYPCDTVRGAFLEGKPIFEGTAISAETHIQIAVRNTDCILGIFRPNL